MAKTNTRILCTTDALSRAADALVAKSGNTLSKNAILNALSAAIAGPGRDWAFLRNAPEGRFEQPGAAEPAAPVADEASTPAPVWVLQFDEQGDWCADTRVFASKDAAFAAFCVDTWWRSPEHDDAAVMEIVKATGSYTFGAADDEEGDYDNAQPYLVSIFEAEVTDIPVDDETHDIAVDIDKGCDVIVLKNANIDTPEQGLDFDDAIYTGVQALHKACRNAGILPADVGDIHFARNCEMTASFRPQLWQNDYAVPVDPQGETDWKVYAHELEPGEDVLDYLRHSRNAPEWVRDWSGPFEVDLEIVPNT